MSKTKSDLQTELEQTQEELSTIQDTVEDLKKALSECQTARDRAVRQREEVETQLAACEAERVELRQNQRVPDISGEDRVSSEIASSKSSFRLDLYEPQGYYRGTIQCLQSKEEKTFKNVNQATLMEAIVDFLAARLPSPSGVEEPLKEVETGPSSDLTDVAEASEIKGQLSLDMPERIIRPTQAIPLCFSLDFSHIAKESFPFQYKLTLYAKRIENSVQQRLDEIEETALAAEMVQIPLEVHLAQEGTYRLQVVMTSFLPDGHPSPYMAFAESELLKVY